MQWSLTHRKTALSVPKSTVHVYSSPASSSPWCFLRGARTFSNFRQAALREVVLLVC